MREIEMKRSHGSVRALALFAYISVLIVSLSGCKDDKDGSSAHMGKVSLNLRADTTSLKKGIHSSVTKAVSDEFADFLTVDDYRILVVAGTDTAKQYDRFDKMPAEFELPEGTYSLIASKGNNLPAEYENPYFEGSTDFTVKEGMSSPLDVTCSLGNTRIMAEYTDDFKEAYSEYTVLLSSANTTADFEIAKGETRPAYMQVAKDGTDIAVGIRLKKVNAEEEKTYYVPNAIKMERRQNVRLIFKTDGEALEGIGLDVMLDDSLATQSFTTKIPDFMWQQFKEPKLSPAGFKDGEVITVRAGYFDSDLTIGFGMPAGIGHLYVKYWPDYLDEEDATIFDLTTKEGVESALANQLSWDVEGVSNSNLYEVRKTGVLHLKDAIRNLKASEDGVITYTYHFYGTDATGKEQATIPYPLILKVNVQKSSLPIVDFEGFPETAIVEGNSTTKKSVANVTMEGGINRYETKLVINHDDINQEYPFTEEGIEQLGTDYGITLDVENTVATVTFPKSFTERLVASEENGFTDYNFTFKLKDEHDKTFEHSYTIKVSVPKFEFLTDDGAAFAKRIVLRTDLQSGDPAKLRYQYRKNGTSNWLNVETMNLKKEASGSTIYKCVLEKLDINTKYDLKVIYNDKYTKETTVTTENPVYDIPNAGFEEYYSELVWERDAIYFGGEKIYAFYPFEKTSSSTWWNTLNLTTTQPLGDYSWYYCAFSGTVPTKELTYTAVNHLNHFGGQSLDGSAYEGDNAMEIATIGWGKNNWLSQSSAQKGVNYRTAGMLYIGDYDLVTHKVSLGKEFTTRPSGVKFYYKFYSYNDESTKAYAQLWAEDGTSIGYGELKIREATNKYEEGFIPINYTILGKATKMTIVFLSTDAASPATLAIQGEQGATTWNGQTGGYGDSRHIGSILTVDDVSLIYE